MGTRFSEANRSHPDRWLKIALATLTLVALSGVVVASLAVTGEASPRLAADHHGVVGVPQVRAPRHEAPAVLSREGGGAIPTSSTVLALQGPTPVSISPGGPTVRREPGVIYGGIETLPVLAVQSTWAEVLEPGPPNGVSGWVPVADGTIESDPWFLVVDLEHRVITAYDEGREVMSAPAAIGAPSTPTPQPPGGRTFVSADIATTGANSAEGPTLRPLALHVGGTEAEVDDAAVGGNLVAIHGWADLQSDPSVWGPQAGLAVSHACVRVPANFAVGPLSEVPNGTLVRVLAQ